MPGKVSRGSHASQPALGLSQVSTKDRGLLSHGLWWSTPDEDAMSRFDQNLTSTVWYHGRENGTMLYLQLIPLSYKQISYKTGIVPV